MVKIEVNADVARRIMESDESIEIVDDVGAARFRQSSYIG